MEVIKKRTKYKQKQWMKNYTYEDSEVKTKSTTKVNKRLSKVKESSLYGKQMENRTKRKK